ncbi:helix-turn-helix domain-containing protein [Teredinibacter turnerae]|uniref:helix-turn-helix domain-containing protein n=1 Tax=Teredinibacter turnerae TaxID=2426 RepID=UPI0003739C9D|nr:helix-turn-helix domain-containing protein [Teredinibacter turnerae]
MDFSDKLKRVVELENINLKIFSDLTDISYGTIRKYSNGERSPSLKQILKITSVPRFSKYRDLLLAQHQEIEERPLSPLFNVGENNEQACYSFKEARLDSNPDDELTAEAVALIERLKELGRGEEALAVLRAIEASAKK